MASLDTLVFLHCLLLIFLRPSTSLTLSCAKGTYPPPASSSSSSSLVASYDIDLDSKPEIRWNHVIKNYVQDLTKLKDLLQPYLESTIKTHLDPSMTLDQFYSHAFNALPSDTQGEYPSR